MQKHVKNYLKYYGYSKDEIILCEVCEKVAVDLHHIKLRSQGGGDEVENIIALCRPDHEKAHKNEIKPEELAKTHNNNL